MAFKAIPVVAAKVPSTQTNFPVLVKPSILTGWGSISLADAQSIRVYSDSAKTTELAREVVGADEIYVKVASLTNTFTLYVDYDGIRADYGVGTSFGRNAVWSGYLAAYHLDSTTDSTGTNTLTNTGTVTFTGGNAGNGALVDTSGQRLETTNSLGLTATQAMTITMMLKMASDLTTDRDIFNICVGANSSQMRMVYEYNGGSRRLRSYRDPNSAFSDISGNIGDNTWRHIALTWTNSASSLFTYMNNGTAATGNSTSTTTGLPTAQTTIGGTQQYTFTKPAIAIMDEFRVIGSVVAADWRTTEYNNLINNATFWGTVTDFGAVLTASNNLLMGV